MNRQQDPQKIVHEYVTAVFNSKLPGHPDDVIFQQE